MTKLALPLISVPAATSRPGPGQFRDGARTASFHQAHRSSDPREAGAANPPAALRRGAVAASRPEPRVERAQRRAVSSHAERGIGPCADPPSLWQVGRSALSDTVDLYE